MSKLMSAKISGKTYRGLKARHYERNRYRQKRWQNEEAAVAEWLPRGRVSVLDVPCGTGRFFHLYQERGLGVTALDISIDMLEIARKKALKIGWNPAVIAAANILDGNLPSPGAGYDTVVCVRLLHLVTQQEAGQVLSKICSLARRQIVLTVRLAPRYVANPSSTTMPERWFRRRVTELGWRVADERKLSHAGWMIMRLERA